MRFPVEKIKEAILNPDREVREEAIYYFARSHSTDPTIMPLVIEAIERYGHEAFGAFVHLRSLVQTDATVAWLIHEIERSSPRTEGFDAHYVESLVSALRYADPAVLKRHEATIAGMQELDELSREAVADRIYVNSFSPDALWGELKEFCEQQDQEGEASDEQFEYVASIVDSMSRYPDQFAEQTLALLSGESDELGGWLESMVIELAGKMKLEAAVPQLVSRLEDSGEWVCEQAHEALARIGTDAVVREIVSRFRAADSDFRVEASMLLENIFSDLSVKTALEFLAEEEDPHLQSVLLQSVLMNFSTEGIEPARQYIIDTPWDPDVLEVRSALLVACKLMGETFPEFEAWLKESNDEEELCKQWIKDHPFDFDAEDDLDDDYLEDLELDYPREGDLGEFDEEDDEQPATVVRMTPHVGRNDPCPCGSGKKYKKCCYRSGAIVEQTDEDQSAAMSAVADKSVAKYPVGTVALYGPDDQTTTKIVAGVIAREGAEPILERWVGSKVIDNPKAKRQMEAFFDRHNVKSVVACEGNLGCPHEEGLDFPLGEDCPFCPFWAGKQGGRRWE